MPRRVIAQSYTRLLSSIRRELARGLKAAQQEVDYHRVITYRNIGGFIQRGILKDKSRAEYGSALYKRLSGDLGIVKETIAQMVRVYRVFPDEPKKMASPGVTISCSRALRIRKSG